MRFLLLLGMLTVCKAALYELIIYANNFAPADIEQRLEADKEALLTKFRSTVPSMSDSLVYYEPGQEVTYVDSGSLRQRSLQISQCPNNCK